MTLTVKCLHASEKDAIVHAYTLKTLNLLELAKFFNTSTRTIGRVLEERGLATPVPRLKGEAHQVMRILHAYGLNADTLVAALERNAEPFLPTQYVQDYLLNASEEELGRLFWKANKHKITIEMKQIALQFSAQPEEAVDAAIPV